MKLSNKDKEAYRTLEEFANDCTLNLARSIVLNNKQKAEIDRLKIELKYCLEHINFEPMTTYRTLMLKNHLERALKFEPIY